LTPKSRKHVKKRSKGKTVVPPPLPKPPANNVHEYRRELGLRKVELARLSGLSDKTIQRIERQEKNFEETTYRKIFNALNKQRRKDELPELRYEEVFPA